MAGFFILTISGNFHFTRRDQQLEVPLASPLTFTLGLELTRDGMTPPPYHRPCMVRGTGVGVSVWRGGEAARIR